MTFAAPLFLLAALAAAIPLLLHMINRHKAPVRPFSTLRFLRLSAQKTRRRKYLHDVLLLLLRVAALLLIALGLARPTITHLRSLLGHRAASAVVLVVDNSASMGSRDQNTERWQTALDSAERLLDQLTERDQVGLLLTCGPPQPQLERLYQNHEVVRQALDAARPAYEQADLAARLRTADRLLAESTLANKEIYVVTDMQAVTWNSLPVGKDAAGGNSSGGNSFQSQSPDGQSPDGQSLGGQSLDGQSSEGNAADGDVPDKKRPPVVLVDASGPPLPNVAVRDVQVQAAAPVAGVPITIAGSLLGDGLVSQQRHLQLMLDGQPVEVSPTLSMEPGESVEHVFQVAVDRPGLHVGELRLVGEDACALDDRRYFAIRVAPSIDVALVKQRQHEVDYLDDTYYLRRALAPLGDDSWAIHVTELTPAGLAAEPLSRFAVVYCVNLPAPQADVARKLVRYMEGGGHVVWIAGENVDAATYGISNDQVAGQLLPLPLDDVREASPQQPDRWRIGWLDETYAPLASLGEPASLYQSVRVTRHVPFVSQDLQGARVLARLADGQPLLVERPIGSGATLMLGITTHVDWSNLPLRPLFMPLVARLTFFLSGADTAEPQLAAGAPIPIPLTDVPQATIEIRRPNGEVVRRTDEQQAGQIRFADTHEPGIYQVNVVEGQVQRRAAWAVNLDARELSALRMPREQLVQRFGDRTLVFCERPDQLVETMRRLREGRSLWELFLFGVLLALVVESYLANRLTSRDEITAPLATPRRRQFRPRRVTIAD
jgi:hypothetical protein